MRGFSRFILATTALTWTGSAFAADQVKFGKPPAWVVPATVPATSNASVEAPIAVLLNDQQIALEPGSTTIYSDVAMKIQNGQGLAAGNISLPWNPATDTLTVHKLLIHRGDKTIDVLASGQSFTTIRRESNLEAATLDGRLTANIQPEGLQAGDILQVAATIEHKDPVMKGHAESVFAGWNAIPIKRGHVRLTWPSELRIKVRQSGSLPDVRPTVKDGRTILEFSLEDIEPVLPPKGAPPRFLLGRLAEASDFASWSDVAELMMPLYREAAVVPASGPLSDEIGKIRTEAKDPIAQAERALSLVQDRVRYVALLMGDGGYVPASAEATWSRRFGDCKGKTALLLAILRELGIKADPVLVNFGLGDALNERLPMVGMFNHVLVRATIGGKTYWLDGTRTGDSVLDRIEIPNFRWGLPLVEAAKLVPLVPSPLSTPDTERTIEIDARAGIYAPAPVTIEEIYRGDSAIGLNAIYSQITAAQKDDLLRGVAKKFFDKITVKSSSVAFDKAKREIRLTIKGEAKLEWDDGWFYVPASSVAYKPDFERQPGPDQDAPIALTYPDYTKRRVSIRLPAGFLARQKQPPAEVKETLAGHEILRTVSFKDDVLTLESTERTLVPEVSHKEAIGAEPRLRTLSDEDVHLRIPSDYRPTEKDLAALAAEMPASASKLLDRGLTFLDAGKYEEAIADFTKGADLQKDNVWHYANRGLAYAWKRDFASAEKDFASAEAIQADNPVVLRGRGLIAEFKGNFTSALSSYEKALSRDPKDSWARLRRAIVFARMGKEDEASSEVDKVLAADPKNVSALVQRAELLAQREDWPAAERDIAAALAVKPMDGRILAVQAMIAVQKKEYNTALDLASQALKLDPSNHLAHNIRAQLLKKEGNTQGAMDAFNEAVTRTPRDSTVLISRAFAHLEAKDFEAAEKDIAAALAIEPSDPMALQAKGSLAMAQGDYDGAIRSLSTALNASPSNGLMLSQRAEAYRQAAKYDLAFADTEAAMKAGLISPSLRLLRINILVQQGVLAAAASEVDQLVMENPSSDFALVAAGKSYAMIGMREKAMESFDRAIAIKPYAYIYLNRSQVLPFSDLEGKLADLDAALKVEPDHEDVLAEKARLLSRSGKHTEAIGLYDRAIKAALNSSYLQFGRAIALERAGRSAEARAALDAERAKAKTAGDLSRLCWWKTIDDVLLKAALEDCRQALRLDPEHRAASESLGMVLLKLGKLKEALAAYDRAVARKAGPSAYMGRAIVRSRLGDLTGARTDAAEARRLRPTIDDTFAGYGLKLEIDQNNTVAQ